MNKLLTVIGHGINLLPHFIEHYTPYVDEIWVVAYKSNISPNIDVEISEIIKDYSNVKIVKIVTDRIFDWEKVTDLYNFVKSEYPNDWWIISDIDEFHLYPKDSLDLLIKYCDDNGYEIVRGGFIDRIGRDGEFSSIEKGGSIWKQFPNAGFFRYPMSGACPNKICVVKGKHIITSGQHYVKIGEHTTWKWQGWNHPLIAPVNTHSVQVHHFKWDETCIDRIKLVSNNKQEYSFSNEYYVMFNALRKCRFKIDIKREEYMFEQNQNKPEYGKYKQWNKLIKQIISS